MVLCEAYIHLNKILVMSVVIPAVNIGFKQSICVCFSWTEISSRTDVKVEGDKRLDKLESFLDKLHNKGRIPKIIVCLSLLFHIFSVN